MKVRLLILNIIMYLVYMLPQNFFRLDYFNINKVDIQESAKMLQPELTKLSEKLYNKNIIYIDSNEIKEFLQKELKRKEKQLNKIKEEIKNIKEKDLSYYAVIGKNIYLVDKAGEIFAYLNEKDVEEVPFIVANSEDEIKEITEFLNELSDLAIFKKVSQIYKINDKEFVIILTDGVKIKTNRIEENDEVNKEKQNKRYLIAQQLYFNMSRERKIDYIDLRFNDYIIKYLGDNK